MAESNSNLTIDDLMIRSVNMILMNSSSVNMILDPNPDRQSRQPSDPSSSDSDSVEEPVAAAAAPADAGTSASIDLKDGFLHLSVASKFRPYLGFNNRGQNWRFMAMPFGLNLAPLIFTKLIRFTVSKLAEENLLCLPYLDDLLIIVRKDCYEDAHGEISYCMKMSMKK